MYTAHKYHRPSPGDRIGRWTLVAIRLVKTDRKRNNFAFCRCECGNESLVTFRALALGTSRSCGCLHRELSAKRAKTHGLTKTSEYMTWRAMRYRCGNPSHPMYPDYGGRGIAVCDRWQRFENFLADMGPRPSKTHSIDRIDNDGNYEPSNCRWSTRAQQQRNKRCTHYVSFNGKSMCVTDWAAYFGVTPSAMFHQIRKYGVDESMRRRFENHRSKS